MRDQDRLVDLLGDRRQARHWTPIFQMMYEQRHDTWDYQWTYAVWAQGGLCILPESNLVTNIGFGADATHTVQPDGHGSGAITPMQFPLKHPQLIIADTKADQFSFNRLHARAPLPVRIARRIGNMIFRS
jgi:hypothetical protein